MVPRLLGLALLLHHFAEIVLLVLELLDQVRLVRVALLHNLLGGLFSRLQGRCHFRNSRQGEHSADGLVDSGRED